VPDNKGTSPVTTLSCVFADGSQFTSYYDPQKLPQSLQDAIANGCRKTGTPE
jgi:hypothetical protein